MATSKSVLEIFAAVLASENLSLSAAASEALANQLKADFSRNFVAKASETQKEINGEMLYRCSRTGVFLPEALIVMGKNLAIAAQSWYARRGTILTKAEKAFTDTMMDSKLTMADRMALLPELQKGIEDIKATTEAGIDGATGLKMALTSYIFDNVKYKQDVTAERALVLLQSLDADALESLEYINTATVEGLNWADAVNTLVTPSEPVATISEPELPPSELATPSEPVATKSNTVSVTDF